MMTDNHTPTPWRVREDTPIPMRLTGNVWRITDGDDFPTSFVPAWDNPKEGEEDGSKEAAANAELIVKAVNAHEALVEALEAVHKLITEGAPHGFNPMEGDWADRLYQSNQATSKALALAKGTE